MKKLTALLLALVLVMGLAACGNTPATNNAPAANGSNNSTTGTTNGTEGTDGTEGTTAATLDGDNGLETIPGVTDEYLDLEEENPTEPEETIPVQEPNAATEIYTNIWNKVPEDNRFFAMGGDFSAPVDGAPGNYALDNEGLEFELYVPADQITQVDAISRLMHAMMANNYTGAVYHLTDAANAESFADAMHEALGSAQWICGQPEKMLIAIIEAEYVLVVFGINDAVNPTETALTAAYPTATIVYNEAIAG